MIQSSIRHVKTIYSKLTIVRSIRLKPTKPILRPTATTSKSSGLIAEKNANSFVDDPVDEPKEPNEAGVQINMNSEAMQQQKLETVSEKAQWNWVRPSKSAVTDEIRLDDDDVIPVFNGILLTNEEVVDGLKRLGGLNIQVIPLNGHLDTLDDFILCTGTSTRHLRKMSDVVVKALMSRGLSMAPGFTGAEGGKDDDWIVVDCYNLAVHVMLADTRRALNLEGHWSEMASRPVVKYDINAAEPDEKQMLEMIERNPIPNYYNTSDYPDDSNKPFHKDAFKTSQFNKSSRGDRGNNKSKKSPNKRNGTLTSKAHGSSRSK